MTKQICHLIIKARGVKNKKETLELINWKNKKDTFSSGIELETDELTSFYEIDSTSDYRLSNVSLLKTTIFELLDLNTVLIFF